MGPSLPYKVYPIKFDTSGGEYIITCPSYYFDNKNKYIFVMPYIPANGNPEYPTCGIVSMDWNEYESKFKFCYEGEKHILNSLYSFNLTPYEINQRFSKVTISGETASIEIYFDGGGGNPTYNNDGIIIEYNN